MGTGRVKSNDATKDVSRAYAGNVEGALGICTNRQPLTRDFDGTVQSGWAHIVFLMPCSTV